jgi:hypothetical protein
MSDFRNDPNFPRDDMQYDSRVQWAAVAVILLLLGGLIAASTWSGSDTTRTASNGPAVETTGAATPMGPAQTAPAPRQPRH